MFLKKIQIGMLGVNCYILGDKDEIIVVDPGAEAEKISDFLLENKLTVKYILLTHCHFEHILAACDVQKNCGGKIVASLKEEQNLLSPAINMTERFARNAVSQKADILLSEGDSLNSGEHCFRIIETPGHTSGSMCLYCEKEKILFSGDTLFYESIGRTDFPTGNFQSLSDSVYTKLYILPDDTTVMPGHGESTTIGHEKTYNLYV